MRKLRKNMRLVSLILVFVLIGLSFWYGKTVYEQGSIWASNAYNTRTNTTCARMGDVYDRDHRTLATTTTDGVRLYLENESARRALSQTVGDQMGMSGVGVENYFSSTLLNISGSLTDRLRSALSGTQSAGSSIRITVDAELTARIAEAFPEGLTGAVCVTNYKTGEILAMVSLPNYDPAALQNRASGQNVADTAFLNRCLQGLYTPGSTFKLVTLASALEHDPNVIHQTFLCTGAWDYGSLRTIGCAGEAVHGELDLVTALAKSCNITYGKLAYQLGIDRLSATASSFGFNENFKFGDFILYNSSFPSTSENIDDLVWAGVGQSEVLVTPLHMSMISGAIANGGTMMKPMLVQEIKSSVGVTTYTGEPTVYRQVVSETTANTIATAMYQAVKSGTATRSAVRGYTVCGKTGSAEVSDDKTVATNAWFTGFIADPAHPYAVSVVVEQGGAGGTAAAPLGGYALQTAIEVVG